MIACYALLCALLSSGSILVNGHINCHVCDDCNADSFEAMFAVSACPSGTQTCVKQLGYDNRVKLSCGIVNDPLDVGCYYDDIDYKKKCVCNISSCNSITGDNTVDFEATTSTTSKPGTTNTFWNWNSGFNYNSGTTQNSDNYNEDTYTYTYNEERYSSSSSGGGYYYGGFGGIIIIIPCCYCFAKKRRINCQPRRGQQVTVVRSNIPHNRLTETGVPSNSAGQVPGFRPHGNGPAVPEVKLPSYTEACETPTPPQPGIPTAETTGQNQGDQTSGVKAGRQNQQDGRVIGGDTTAENITRPVLTLPEFVVPGEPTGPPSQHSIQI